MTMTLDMTAQTQGAPLPPSQAWLHWLETRVLIAQLLVVSGPIALQKWKPGLRWVKEPA